MLKSAFRAACLAGAAIVVTAGAAPAAAQVETIVDYDLPAQSLGDRVRSISRLSGREIIFSSDAVAGYRAGPLRGRFTVAQAIETSLSGTGAEAEFRDGVLIVRDRTAASGSAAERAEGTESADSAVTVTGSRIRGGGGAVPVIVATRGELEQAGVTDLAGFTRVLPQNFTGGQNPGIAGGGSQGGQTNLNNSATLNLRGLGPDATLTLLNGHRLAYDALSQGIDISAIPLGAIERIEVITDGASALYGSDAVGGVANIILRRDYRGLETTARVGASTDGGNVQQQYSAVGGARWTDGGFMLALDHGRSTPIYAGDRDYTSSLDPSLTLTLRSAQYSGVLSGHQRLTAGLELELDGYVMQRQSRKQSPFLPDASVFTNGLVSRPEVISWGLTPTLRLDLPGDWRGSVSATHAVSRTRLDTSRYTNAVEARSRLTYENQLKGIEASAEGPLFALPGGDARLALGGGARQVELHLNITDIFPDREVVFRDFTETRGVLFAYGEISLPLIGPDTGVPLVERLSLSGAARYERYDGIAGVTTPKLGLVYQPVRDVTFRATWGRSFKVPTLNQVNQVPQFVLLPGVIFQQPTPPLAADATVLLLGGGNPDLRAERAANWSASLELRPRFLAGLRLEVGYFDIDYEDRIGTPLSGTLSSLANPVFRDLITFNPGAADVNALIATYPQGFSNQTGQPFDPAKVGAIIDGAIRNTARDRVRGVDMLADYRADLGDGRRLSLSAAASYLETDTQLAPNQPVFERAGTIFNPPHWRARFGAAWQGRQGGVSAYLNYVGSTRDNRFPVVERVGSFVTLDLNASFRTGAAAGPLGNVEIRISALNLLNEEPDIIRNSQPEAPSYDSTNQSPVGRFVGLSIRKSW